MPELRPMLSPLVVAIDGELKQSVFESAISDTLGKDLDAHAGASVLFDLSQSHWYDLGTTLWFITLLHRLRSNRTDVQIQLPDQNDGATARKLWAFLHRWRFFETLRTCVDDPQNLIVPS